MNRIIIDARVESDLDWSAAKEEACEAESILWEIDLGLFSGLKQPISNETQFRSLSLSLQHFCETLLEPFLDKTEGICLYRGTPELSEDEAEYLELLRCTLPDDVDCILEFDLLEDPILTAILTIRECYRDFQVRGGLSDEDAAIGISLPETHADKLLPAMKELQKAKIPFRVIPESLLTMKWHGLDHLLYVPSGTGGQGVRKLQGFAAAGGNLISVEDSRWMENLN